MPELPEVETVRIQLEASIVGKTIAAMHPNLEHSAVLRAPDGVDPVSSVTGETILQIDRRGKYLLVELTGGWWLVIHLRMTGRLVIVDSSHAPIRFEHLTIRLTNGTDLRFGDQRKFGGVVVCADEYVRSLTKRLGVEPLSGAFNGKRLKTLLTGRTSRVKSALLDQRLIAGLGNIYVDEALFRSKIHPLRLSGSLSLEECTRLARAIRHVLRLGIENRGTTFSTFANAYGESGTNATFLQVYGKGGHDAACPRCGTPLERIVIGGRGTSFCPTCQPIIR